MQLSPKFHNFLNFCWNFLTFWTFIEISYFFLIRSNFLIFRLNLPTFPVLSTTFVIHTKPCPDDAVPTNSMISAHWDVPFQKLDPTKVFTKWDPHTRWTTPPTSWPRFTTMDQSKVSSTRVQLGCSHLDSKIFQTATMWVYPDFFTYRGGIYRRSDFGSAAKGFHSVRLIGWGEETFNGRTQKYWVSRNTFAIKARSWSFIFRSPPIPGVDGGARRATSESCVESTNAKSNPTFSHRLPTSTKPSRPADSCGAQDCRSVASTTATQLLIKRTTWYPRFNAIEEKEIMWIVQSICFSSSSEVHEERRKQLPRLTRTLFKSTERV